MKKWIKHISWLLLALFVTTQVGALHELTHQDDSDQECEWCISIQSSTNYDVSLAAITVAPTTSIDTPSDEVLMEYAFAKASSRSYRFITRPPPVMFL